MTSHSGLWLQRTLQIDKRARANFTQGGLTKRFGSKANGKGGGIKRGDSQASTIDCDAVTEGEAMQGEASLDNHLETTIGERAKGEDGAHFFDDACEHGSGGGRSRNREDCSGQKRQRGAR